MCIPYFASPTCGVEHGWFTGEWHRDFCPQATVLLNGRLQRCGNANAQSTRFFVNVPYMCAQCSQGMALGQAQWGERRRLLRGALEARRGGAALYGRQPGAAESGSGQVPVGGREAWESVAGGIQTTTRLMTTEYAARASNRRVSSAGQNAAGGMGEPAVGLGNDFVGESMIGFLNEPLPELLQEPIPDFSNEQMPDFLSEPIPSFSDEEIAFLDRETASFLNEPIPSLSDEEIAFLDREMNGFLNEQMPGFSNSSGPIPGFSNESMFGLSDEPIPDFLNGEMAGFLNNPMPELFNEFMAETVTDLAPEPAPDSPAEQ